MPSRLAAKHERGLVAGSVITTPIGLDRPPSRAADEVYATQADEEKLAE
jgi:hypothetical protein